MQKISLFAKKKKKVKVRTVVGKDISAWGCEVVSSNERGVVLCNECGKNHFCPGDFFGCGCLE